MSRAAARSAHQKSDEIRGEDTRRRGEEGCEEGCGRDRGTPGRTAPLFSRENCMTAMSDRKMMPINTCVAVATTERPCCGAEARGRAVASCEGRVGGREQRAAVLLALDGEERPPRWARGACTVRRGTCSLRFLETRSAVWLTIWSRGAVGT